MYSVIYELQARNHLDEEKQNKAKQNNLFTPKRVYSQLDERFLESILFFFSFYILELERLF